MEIVLNTLKMYSNMFILEVTGFRVTDLIVWAQDISKNFWAQITNNMDNVDAIRSIV